MKKLLTILLSLSFLQPVVGQNDSIIKKSAFKNQMDLDVYFLGVEASYKRKINSSLFLGVGLGGLMARSTLNSEFEISSISELIDDFSFTEIVRIRPFLGFQLSKIFYFETGITLAGTLSLDDDDVGYSVGLETGVFVGGKKLLIGIRPSLLFYKSSDGGNFNSPVLTTSFLIIKIPLSRW